MIGVAVRVHNPADGKLVPGDLLGHSLRWGGRIDEHTLTGRWTTDDITDNF
jgi:hypothetical protein